MASRAANSLQAEASRAGLFDAATSNAIYRYAAILLLTLLAMRIAGAAPGPFAENGWYSWRIEAADDVPAWCCMTWSGGKASASACNLEGRQYGFGGLENGLTPVGEMQVYVRIRDGKASRIRTLSPQCLIEAPADITSFGAIDNEESLAWLGEQVGDASRVTEDALTAIAMHRGRTAVDMLVETAESGADRETRKDAIFWMAQLRVKETEGHLQQFMLEDPDPKIREHAAFALAESASPNRVEALSRQGKEDRNADVRGQAWFWLAQTALPGVETVIEEAVTEDPSRKVREEAVFALSQLPDDRAVDSLLGILRDKDKPQHIREQALFWLVESDSDAAYAEIEKLLAARE